MGENINACFMLGLPLTEKCPSCGEQTSTMFDDVDVSLEVCQPEPGKIVQTWSCTYCDAYLKFTATLTATVEVSVLPRPG
jgi:hypothetical protein